MFDVAKSHVQCQCGQTFQVLEEDGSDWDAKASMTRAYQHYLACAVALEEAPQLIVAMNETLTENGWPVPTTALL